MKQWKKKVGASLLTTGLLFGVFAPGAFAGKSSTVQNGQSFDMSTHFNKPGPVDLGIVHDERLIKSLEKQGVIKKNASHVEKQNALKAYLKKRANQTLKADQGELHEKADKKQKEVRDELLHNAQAFLKGNGQKKGLSKKVDVAPVKKEEWNGGKRVDNILVLLIDYKDFSNNNIKPDETDMYYQNYSKEHYEQMLFGENGYAGPNGNTLISMKQYYEQQSGGSYSVEGTVAGWYTAKNDAAYYGGNVPAPDGNDARPRSLVYEALIQAANDPSVDLSQFDKEDRYDLDGDGNTREPDGLIDHLMVIHAGVGEEAGGGSLGGDAIWSHRWNLGGVAAIPGTTSEVSYWGGSLAAYDYTIEPEDGATGVFAHEYGHDLGLPDEYDTIYSGTGEAVAYWSIMASGSWAGSIPGTEPTGFSAWAKQYLQASMPGSNWLSGAVIDYDDVNSSGIMVNLDQANDKGTNNDVVRVDLPEKETVVNTPYSGEYEYFSGKGNDLDQSMITTLDLTGVSSAELAFKAWYQIEQDWDYASVQVREVGTDTWTSIPGNLTTTDNPYEQNPGHGITGYSNGWVDGIFDLSAFAGKQIQLKLNYWTDVAAAEPGFYVDDIKVTADGMQMLLDDAEGESSFTLEGFTKDTGKFYSAHYYLLEWRNHEGVDEGLKHIRRGNSLMTYDPGLVVWYADESYDNNWTGIHPGEGYLGVVDAHQKLAYWSDKTVASTRYQVQDAAFSLKKPDNEYLDYQDLLGITLKKHGDNANMLFDDSKSYLNSGMPDAGRNVPNYGLKFRVLGEATDRSASVISIFK